ncbi:MAG TPA: hypothetical protein PKH78_15935, partial [Candidatus Obscuribacter sp.]|nr:hypothetical protein [Candidatus Obscuribacter sp.]
SRLNYQVKSVGIARLHSEDRNATALNSITIVGLTGSNQRGYWRVAGRGGDLKKSSVIWIQEDSG